MNIYEEKGFLDRQDYLEDLADQFGVDIKTVESLSDLLGPNEDFDGLINSLEDL